jgi:hypothetical protein
MFVLLRGAGEELRKLGRRGTIIKKVYARSQTPTGIAMAIHAGMKEYAPMPRTVKLVRFVLDIEVSTSYLAQSYKEGLEEWKQEQKRVGQDGRQERKRNKTAPRFEKEREAEAI